MRGREASDLVTSPPVQIAEHILDLCERRTDSSGNSFARAFASKSPIPKACTGRKRGRRQHRRWARVESGADCPATPARPDDAHQKPSINRSTSRDAGRCDGSSPILKFLARRGFVFREGTNWRTPHLRWLLHRTTEGSPLAPHDRLVFRE